jgi:Zn-dependent protease with chaperone function
MSTSVYTDLRSAVRRDVEVVFEPLGLKLIDKLGVIVAYWPYEELNLVEQAPNTTSVRLAHKHQAQRYLVSEDPSVLGGIKKLPSFSRPSVVEPLQLFRLFMLGLTGFLFYFLFAKGSEFLAVPLSHQLPLAWETRVSDGLLEKLRAQATTCASPEGQAALAKITQPLDSIAGLPFPTQAHVVMHDSFNAFSLGGGQVVISNAVLEKARGPEDIAAVVAHAMAHAAERQQIAALIRSLGLGFVGRTYVDEFLGVRGVSTDSLRRVTEAKYTADEEDAAVRIALLYLAQIGVRGSILSDLLLSLNAAVPESPAYAFRQAHPIVLKKSRIKQPAESVLMNKEEWASLKNICSLVIRPHTIKR